MQKVQKKTHVPATHTRKAPTISANQQKAIIDGILLNTVAAQKKKNHMVPKSALTKHYVATGHEFSGKDFKIVLSDQHRYRLLIKESLLIRKRQPKLNGTDRSLPLYIYPDGIQEKEKNKLNIATTTSADHINTGITNT